MAKPKYTQFKISAVITTDSKTTEEDLGESLKRVWESGLVQGTNIKGKLIGIKTKKKSGVKRSS